jgi:hypothetical protein
MHYSVCLLRMLVVLCVLFAYGCSCSSTHRNQDGDLVGCPRNASEDFKTGWARAIAGIRPAHEMCLQMREQLDERYGEGMARLLAKTTEDFRSGFEKQLELLQWSKDEEDYVRGEYEGIKYGLRYILKSRY